MYGDGAARLAGGAVRWHSPHDLGEGAPPYGELGRPRKRRHPPAVDSEGRTRAAAPPPPPPSPAPPEASSVPAALYSVGDLVRFQTAAGRYAVGMVRAPPRPGDRVVLVATVGGQCLWQPLAKVRVAVGSDSGYIGALRHYDALMATPLPRAPARPPAHGRPQQPMGHRVPPAAEAALQAAASAAADDYGAMHGGAAAARTSTARRGRPAGSRSGARPSGKRKVGRGIRVHGGRGGGRGRGRAVASRYGAEEEEDDEADDDDDENDAVAEVGAEFDSEEESEASDTDGGGSAIVEGAKPVGERRAALPSWEPPPPADAGSLERDVQCPICLDPITTAVSTPCLHRFCAGCLERWMRLGNHDCPECRGYIKTRRALRPDKRFDEIVAMVASGELKPSPFAVEAAKQRAAAAMARGELGIPEDAADRRRRRKRDRDEAYRRAPPRRRPTAPPAPYQRDAAFAGPAPGGGDGGDGGDDASHLTRRGSAVARKNAASLSRAGGTHKRPQLLGAVPRSASHAVADDFDASTELFPYGNSELYVVHNETHAACGRSGIVIARHRGGALHLRLSDTGEVLVVAANDVAPLRPPGVAGPPPVAVGADVAPPAPPMATRPLLAAAPSTEAPSEVRNASDDDDDGLDETMFDRRPLPTAINDDNGASAASDAREIIDLDAPAPAAPTAEAPTAEAPAAEAPAAEAPAAGRPRRSRGRHVHPPRRRRRPRRRRPRRRLSAACVRPGRVPPSSRRGPCACRLTARRGVSSSSPAAARYGSSSATRRIQDGLRMGRWSDCTITALVLINAPIDYKMHSGQRARSESIFVHPRARQSR